MILFSYISYMYVKLKLDMIKRHPCCPFALCIIYYIEIPQDEGIYVLSNFGCLNKSWVYMKTGLVDQNFRIGQIYLGAKTWSWQLDSDSGGS